MAYKKHSYLLLENVNALRHLASVAAKDVPMAQKSKQFLEVVIGLKLKGRTTLKEMSSASYMSAANISTTVRRLEEQGLVARETSMDDHRNVWYSLTAAGNKAAVDAIDKFLERINDLSKNLSARDEARFAAALTTVNEMLEKMK
ncbi:MAG: MarR family transcriptional regulator [Rickettsiales bacterium]|jgi:DNA-binding MarR family transcriptional regulator|nr:MarR family transcriptional regulator [Rickettsiales bacterium]